MAEEFITRQNDWIEFADFGKIIQGSNEIGTVGKPNSFSEHKKVHKGQTIFDVKYQLDSSGLRKTIQSAAESSEKFIWTFGDSNVFGEGIADKETLASQFATAFPEIHVKNFGLFTHSPSSMLARLQSQPDLLRSVKNKQGDFFYFINDTSVALLSGKVTFAQGTPRYKLESNELVRNALFGKNEPGATSNCIPSRLANEDFELMGKIFSELKSLIRKNSPLSHFKIIILPITLDAETILKTLDKNDIDYLDLSYLDLDFYFPNNSRLNDGHNSPTTNKVILAAICRAKKGGWRQIPRLADSCGDSPDEIERLLFNYGFRIPCHVQFPHDDAMEYVLRGLKRSKIQTFDDQRFDDLLQVLQQGYKFKLEKIKNPHATSPMLSTANQNYLQMVYSELKPFMEKIHL